MIDKVDDAVIGVIPPARRTLESEWQELIGMVFAAGEWVQLSGEQQREMRRAYYAGAAAMIALLTPCLHDSSPDELRYVLNLHSEITAFANSIGDGDA